MATKKEPVDGGSNEGRGQKSLLIALREHPLCLAVLALSVVSLVGLDAFGPVQGTVLQKGPSGPEWVAWTLEAQIAGYGAWCASGAACLGSLAWLSWKLGNQVLAAIELLGITLFFLLWTMGPFIDRDLREVTGLEEAIPGARLSKRFNGRYEVLGESYVALGQYRTPILGSELPALVPREKLPGVVWSLSQDSSDAEVIEELDGQRWALVRGSRVQWIFSFESGLTQRLEDLCAVSPLVGVGEDSDLSDLRRELMAWVSKAPGEGCQQEERLDLARRHPSARVREVLSTVLREGTSSIH